MNVSSLETVVRHYLSLADERTEAARKESHQAVVDIDDLDNLATPEEILLSAVSGEDAQVSWWPPCLTDHEGCWFLYIFITIITLPTTVIVANLFTYVSVFI